MTTSTKFNKFLLLGLTAITLGGYAIANADSVKNSIDSQIYNVSGMSVFHSMEDIRYENIKNQVNLLDKIYKEDITSSESFTDFKSAFNNSTYKEGLKDPFCYDDDLITLKDIEKELKASKKSAIDFGQSVKPPSPYNNVVSHSLSSLKEPLDKEKTLHRISNIKDRDKNSLANESTLFSKLKK